ncbi:HET-domain-containing protein [Apiospora arundinis]
MTTIRSLGIRYIWIDSLCIIQNSEEDWRTEAATMGNVYQHALLNLAATHGNDGHAGLFTFQDPLTGSGVFQVNGSSEPGGGSVVDMIVAKDVGVPSGPLGMRGWVLQERLLSRRIVHFDDGYALWDCAQRTAWDLAPRGPPSAIKGAKASSPYLKTGSNPLTDENLKSAWNNIIQTYCHLDLTVRSDRPVAISGIAEILGAKFGEQYVQGLWRTDLEEQLCWQAWGPREGGRIEHVPSWTWMSLGNTAVLQGWTLGEGRSEIRKPKTASIINVGESLMQIQVRCVCYEMTFTSRPVWDTDFEAEFTIPSVSASVPFHVTLDTTDTEFRDDLLFAILYDAYHKIKGLLIEPVKGAIGTYTRLGRFERWITAQELCDAVNESSYEKYPFPAPGECTKCQEHDNQLGCLITLV